MEPNTNIITTQDGTLTYYHPEYKEHYHSLIGAKTEAIQKFIQPSGIISYPDPQLLDIGFGCGYNALYSLLLCSQISIISLEKDKHLLSQLDNIHSEPLLKEIISILKQKPEYKIESKSLKLVYGDARESVQNLYNTSVQFSHIFLDAFSPSVNPELWTLDFFKYLYNLLQQDGLLITYSSSLAVMSALARVGFSIFYTANIGRKRGGIIAFKGKPIQGLENISLKDQFLLNYSTHSIPNRDKGLWNQQQIIDYRKATQEIAVRLGFLKPHKTALKLWEQQGI